ncbi:hypothetical protein EDC02_3714 [Micromonospora sp. Llam0]|uniref:hypothetical protein n=1 Tax=Micromonospora sp. Llam0 TaxID=2485143 RepID=UPI000FAD43DB|nr:hypothetical protein [Micromonospora sp. Llam0]ROO61762.1 hypothetical protein EDC02_3714 [Micromonospora sp. Llam0]
MDNTELVKAQAWSAFLDALPGRDLVARTDESHDQLMKMRCAAGVSPDFSSTDHGVRTYAHAG